MSDEIAPSIVVQETSEFGQIFIHSSVDDAGLSPAEFRVYGHLARRAGGDTAYPGIDSMAQTCRLSTVTVVAAVRELERHGMLKVKRVNGKCSQYRLPKPSLWKTPDRVKRCNGTPQAPCQTLQRTVSNAATVPCQTLQRKILHRSKSIEVNPLPSSEGLKFADWFKSTLPTGHDTGYNWRNNYGRAFDENVRIDKRSPETVWAVAKFARADNFWSQHFLSPLKLRNKDGNGVKYFDKLSARMGGNGQHRPIPKFPVPTPPDTRPEEKEMWREMFAEGKRRAERENPDEWTTR